MITALGFTNSGGGALTDCAVDRKLPAGLSLEFTSGNSTCRLTGTPTMSKEQVTYTVTATNVTGDDDATIRITVNLTEPSLADAEEQTYDINEMITALVFTNSGGGELNECTVEPDLPDGLNIEQSPNNASCQITGTPTEDSTRKPYTVTATNDAGDDTALVGILVNPSAPSLSDGEAKIYAIGQNVSVPFTNLGGGKLMNCTIEPDPPTGLDAEISSNNATCEIIGIPLELKAQTDYTVTATNVTDSNTAGIALAVGDVFLPDTVTTTNNVAQLSWEALTPTTEYEVWRAEVDESPDGVEIVRRRNRDATTTFTDTNLTANTDYYYLIAECTSIGCVDPSNTGPVAVASLRDTVETRLRGAEAITITTIGDKIYALVAAGDDHSLQIIEITNPIDPSPVDIVHDNDRAGLELRGSADVTTTTIGDKTYALVAANTDHGVQIIDISDPADSTPTIALSDNNDTLLLEGATGITTIAIGIKTYALVASSVDNGVQIIDISGLNDATPSISPIVALLDSGQTLLQAPGSITAITIRGKAFALVSSLFDDGVQIIDITKLSSDPPVATPINNLPDASDRLLVGANGIATTTIGDRIYALVAAFFEHGMQMIDITNLSSDPPAIVVAGRMGDTIHRELRGAAEITGMAVGNRFYALVAAQMDNGVQIIDISNPRDATTLVAVASLDDSDQSRLVLGGARDIVTATINGRVYALVAAENDNGIQIIDVSTPQQVKPASSSP